MSYKVLTLAAILFFGLNLALANTIPIKVLDIENGLSNNNVTCIYKDHYGFMWIGTFQGLNRYNGYDFQVFKNKLGDSSTLCNNYVSAITEDNDNRLWVGTQHGVSIYNGRTARFSYLYFRQPDLKKAQRSVSYVNCLQRDPVGNIFIGLNKTGLLFCAKGATIASSIQFKTASGKLKRDYNVQAISIIAGQIWVFIQNEGLYLLDRQNFNLQLINKTVNQASCMAAGNNNDLWIGSYDGAYHYSIGKNSYQHYTEKENGLSGNIITSFCIDKNSIWMATDGDGITIMDSKTQKNSYLSTGNYKTDLNSAAVYTIFKDKQDRKWVGTLRGGVNIIDPAKNQFNLIEQVKGNKNTINNNFILSFCEDIRRNIWIGTDGAGLNYWDRYRNKFTTFTHQPDNQQSLSNNYVTNILQDHKAQIWVSTYGGGIDRYQPETGGFSHYNCFDTLRSQLSNAIWYLAEDHQQQIWAAAGADKGGLYRYNYAKNKFESFDNKYNTVFTINISRSGQLWIGTFNAIARIDTINHRDLTVTLNSPVRCIHEDQLGNIWAGTEGGGLFCYQPATQKLTRITEANGLPSNSILNILEDKHGRLWLSTYNGLSRYDPQKKEALNFFESDGLQSNQFNYNAALALQNGQFLFGGIKGFNIFYPDQIRQDTHVPDVFLTGLKIDNIPFENAGDHQTSVINLRKLTVPYSKAALNLEFAAPEYSYLDKIHYSYFLQGWDKAWNEAGNARVSNYSRLTEGQYILHIKATNTGNHYSGNERIIYITVLPPWYRAWWAYLVYGCAICAAAFYYLRYQKKQLHLQQQITIAHIEAQKEKELNEKRLSFFTNISHEFRTPLTLIINPVKDLIKASVGGESDDLNIIYRNARRLLGLIDQLLVFRKAEAETGKLKIEQLNLFILVKEVFLCFEHQARKNNLHYRLQAVQEELTVFGDREKLEIVVFNLISNAIKFTPDGGKVEIRLSEDAQNVFLSVEDSGCGISDETGVNIYEKFYQLPNQSPLKNGFGIGLYLVKSFVEGHRGNITYQTQLDKGTAFQISLKKGSSHFDQSKIIKNKSLQPSILQELIKLNMIQDTPVIDTAVQVPGELVSARQTIVVIDDDVQILAYFEHLFAQQYHIFTAANALQGFDLIKTKMPDLVISDVVMDGQSGVALCNRLKADELLNHIPIILLTASASAESAIDGLREGADDYISKPFDNEMLMIRISNLLKSRADLQKYFYNEITLKTSKTKISEEYKEFLNKCIFIVEMHLLDEDFSIKTLATEIGMSHSALYKKIKSISGQSVNGFIRFIRLRKAADLLINTDLNVNEVAFQVGLNDLKYFREQFNKLFGVNPSIYIRRHRKTFNKSYVLTQQTDH